MRLSVKPVARIEGKIRVPGDKSISHRAVMLGSLACGRTEISGFLQAADCLSTIGCCRSLGVSVEINGNQVTVSGRGSEGLHEPEGLLDAGNSGTTIRLLSGILAGQPFTSFISGDESLCRRPMARVTEPLKLMGAQIIGRGDGRYAPLGIRGGNLKPISYRLPVASAQVKSSLLLAGLFAPGWTELEEPAPSRNHTELMLKAMGAILETTDCRVRVKGGAQLKGGTIVVPGDLSSAAFFIVAALIAPRGRLTIEGVGLNPTRAGLLEALKEMGARITVRERSEATGELMGTLDIEPSELKGITLGGAIIPRLIDEVPILAVAALFANGITEIRDAAELKVKESNRITTICQGLSRLGARVEELYDGLRIYGGYPLKGNTCSSHYDHRIAMALAVAGLRAEGQTHIEEAESVNISFPQFPDLLASVTGE